MKCRTKNELNSKINMLEIIVEKSVQHSHSQQSDKSSTESLLRDQQILEPAPTIR